MKDEDKTAKAVIKMQANVRGFLVRRKKSAITAPKVLSRVMPSNEMKKMQVEKNKSQ